MVVFELKRGILTRDAVAQAIDYGSYLSNLAHGELCAHIVANSGKGGVEKIDDFASWYQNNFQRTSTEIGRPRIVLVGLGVDERAKRMVEFLAQCELDISMLTFYGFRENDQTYLAKQVEVTSRTEEQTVTQTKA